jgi:cation diffusion facilitator family transporter
VEARHDHPHEHFGAPDAAAAATRHGVRATWISLGILAATGLLQLAIVSLSGSVALLADTIHNLTDALTAIPLLIAFRLGRRPPSRRYPYGLHRAEDLAGVVIVLLILFSAVFAAAEAFERLLHPREPDRLGLVLAAGVIGFMGNEVVAIYRIRVGRRIGSAALVADGLHARTDGLTSLGVVLSAIATFAGLARADAVVGLAITLVIVWTLIGAARGVLHRILDGTDEETITLIEEVAAAVPGVEHVTEARARWTGHRLRAELSIDVDPAISVEEGHHIAERVRQTLQAGVPRLDAAAVHVDPHEHDAHGA